MSLRSSSAFLDSSYSAMVEAGFGGGDNVADLSPADTTLLSLDQGESQRIALALIMANQVADIVAGIGVFAASDLGINPLAHRIGQRYVQGCHRAPLFSIVYDKACQYMFGGLAW